MPEMRPIGPHDPRAAQRLNALRKPHEPVGKRFIIKPGTVSSAIHFNEGFTNGIPQRFILQLPDAPPFYMHKKHVGESVPKEGDQTAPAFSAPEQDAPKDKKPKAKAPAPSRPAASPAQKTNATIQNTRITYIISQTSRLEPDHIFEGAEIAEIKEKAWVRIGPSNTDFVFNRERPKPTGDEADRPVFSIHRQGDWFYVHNSSKEEIVIWVGEDIPDVAKPAASSQLSPAPSPAEVLANIAKRESRSPAPAPADMFDTSSLQLKIVIGGIAKNNVQVVAPEKPEQLKEAMKKSRASVDPVNGRLRFSAFMNLDGEIVSIGPLGDQGDEIKASVSERKLVTVWIAVRTKANDPGSNFALELDKAVGSTPRIEDARKATEEELNGKPNPYLGKLG